MIAKLLGAVLGASLLLASSGAFAQEDVRHLGNVTPPPAGRNPFPPVVVSYSPLQELVLFGTFTLDTPASLAILTTIPVSGLETIDGGSLALFEGTPPLDDADIARSSPILIFRKPLELRSSIYTGELDLSVPAGVYFTEILGDASDPVIASLSLQSSAVVPEASTWAMLVLGFAGAGFAGYGLRRRTAIAG